jgi:type II secretory pathway component PulF
MPVFEYQGFDSAGTTVSGNAVGASLESVLSDLGSRGLKVERINVAAGTQDTIAAPPPQVTAAPPPQVAAVQERPRTEMPSLEVPFDERVFDAPNRSFVQTKVLGPIFTKAPLVAVGQYFRQFATMQNAGVPPIQTVETLAAQQHDPRMQPIVVEVARVVKAGDQISVALQRFPESISSVILAVVKVGEEGGFVPESLHMAADYIDREIELRRAYQRATFYPKLVLGASFFVIGAANTIISMVAPGQQGLSSPLSLMTWIFLAAAGAGIWLFLRVGLANPSIKYNFDQNILRIPVLGNTLRELAMAKFGRAFAAMYKAGVPIQRAMMLSADACGNEYLRVRMQPSFRRMGEGVGIFEAVAATGVFPRMILDMISTGERTGNLDQMLTKVADYYELEAGNRQQMLAVITGVVLMVLMGVYVGYMVITFYVGHYSSLQSAANPDGMILPLKWIPWMS